MKEAKDFLSSGVNAAFVKMLENAPDAPDTEGDPPCQDGPSLKISRQTGVPSRYAPIWSHPEASEWVATFARCRDEVESGGLLALIGKRGTGKTRMAVEIIREYSRNKAHYTTAMGLFLRIRDSYNKKKSESELEIVNDLSRCPLLVLDEIQERGNSEWEDRLLNHIVDRRYGNGKPTILIANLTKKELAESLGSSIISRMNETGGVVEMNGPSHRTKK